MKILNRRVINPNKFLLVILSVIIFTIICSVQLNAQQKHFRWAADAEGNVPYIFQDPKNPANLLGFEVDISNALAKEMGMEPRFVQNQWDGLIPGLNRDDYDVAINGLEITEDRKREVNFSIPYYITFEQIVVLKYNNDINSLADCIGKKVGALKNSLAERILVAKRGINVRSYEGEVNAFTDMENGRLDAVLVDAPIAIYYAQPDPKYKLVGQPIGEVSYGVAIRKSDNELLNRINEAIKSLADKGELRVIYERWNLWNYMMEVHFNDHSDSNIDPDKYKAFLATRNEESSFKSTINRYITYLPTFGLAALTTLEISLLSMLVAVLLGLILALTRVYAPVPFSTCSVTFIEFIRGTPLLIQLYFIYYALPSFGLNVSPILAAVIGLGLNYSAYEAENYRAGLYSVPRGQMEAAISLGMSRTQALRHVIIPQAVRIVIPPMTNDFISLLKDSSLVSIITMVELTKVYFQIASATYDYFGTGILVAMFYLLIGLPFVQLAKMAEAKFSIDKSKKSRRV